MERNIEREHLPAARECGLGVCPWSPLAGGFLAGKYEREAADVGASLGAGGGASLGPKGEGRLTVWKGFKTLTDRHWRTLDAVRTLAVQVNRPMAQVALAWACAQPGITSPILGASQRAHLDDNLASLDIAVTPEQLKTLNDASALEAVFPYSLFTDDVNRTVFGGATVKGW